jgi:PKD repeat protein
MVIGYWFYLISVGGSGTNELGSTFSVTAIGRAKAADISFRLLSTYLTPDATYADARFYAIQSAIDLYGPCTPEVEAVTNAWYACGVGSPYVPYVVADFDAPLHVSCSAPLSVSFQNTSINASVFNWNFGDGGTSTLASPSHTYNSVGEYTVVLYASGGSCGSDTITLTDYVSISPANPCVVYLPVTGTAATQTACNGKLYDSGGPTGNYQDNVDAVITLAPPGATDVTINFVEFNIEPGSGSTCDYDYIEIFDGPNTSSPSLGEFCNTNGSPGTVTSSGGSLTILLHSDGGLNLSGFELDWTCNLSMVAPVSDFVFNTPNCTGTVNFSDESINGPANWVWVFGDGSTSTQQNPVHTYAQSGTYDVTLITSNPYGSDTLTIAGAITVVRPDPPFVNEDTVCTGEPAVLTASASGLVRWFATPSGTIWIGTGNTYTTPILSTTTTYYAENFEAATSQYVGPTNNTSNGDYFTSSNIHYLEFDCFSACRIVSVSVNASTSGVRTFVLINSAGDTIDQITVSVPSGVSRVNVNLDVPAGNDFRLAGPGNPNLFRSNAGLSYPYNLGGYISITNSSASANPTGYYYFFYDWEVKGPDCISDRVPVEAVVEICTGNEMTLENQTEIYPNPSQGIFNISNSSITNWEITDIRGQVIAADISTGTDGIIRIDLSGLAPGVYILRGTNEDNAIIRKLVVE